MIVQKIVNRHSEFICFFQLEDIDEELNPKRLLSIPRKYIDDIMNFIYRLNWNLMYGIFLKDYFLDKKTIDRKEYLEHKIEYDEALKIFHKRIFGI